MPRGQGPGQPPEPLAALPDQERADWQARLRDLLKGLDPGDRLILVKDGEEVATLTKSLPKRWPCQAGSAKDTAHWMAPDFDATPAEFRDYMG